MESEEFYLEYSWVRFFLFFLYVCTRSIWLVIQQRSAVSWGRDKRDECDKAVATAFKIDLNVRILGFQNWLFTILLLQFNICFRVFFLYFMCVSDSCQSIFVCTVCVYLRVHFQWLNQMERIEWQFIHSLILLKYVVIQSVVLAFFFLSFLLHCCWLSLFLLLTITVLRIQFKRHDKIEIFRWHSA